MDSQTIPSGWHLAKGYKSLGRDFSFVDFRSAFAFMSRVAVHAEDLNHHPDWSNSYNQVQIRLTTHSESRITNLDIELAHRINRIYSDMRSEQS